MGMLRSRFGLVVVIVVAMSGAGPVTACAMDEAATQEAAERSKPSPLQEQATNTSALRTQDNAPALPELAGITGWVNSGPLTLASLRGKVVLVDFWTHGCYNCLNTLPYLKEWYSKYSPSGFEIVGVHTPEFDYEKRIENVERFTRENGIGWPVALDNDYMTWNAYSNRYWPHIFLADTQGCIRYQYVGEGAYEKTEGWIRRLLVEAGVDVSGIPFGKTG